MVARRGSGAVLDLWIFQKKTNAIAAGGGRIGRVNENDVGPHHLHPRRLRRWPLEVVLNKLGTIPERMMIPIIFWTIVYRLPKEPSLRERMRNPREVDPPLCLMPIAVE